MSCSNSKEDRWIRHHTNTIITNDDTKTHAICFRQHKTLFKMSIAKATYTESCVNYNITNNTNWTCNVSWEGSNGSQVYAINPTQTISGSTPYVGSNSSSNTAVFLFKDPNNTYNWTYAGSIRYSNTPAGIPSVYFQCTSAYSPISMNITIPSYSVNTTIYPTGSSIYTPLLSTTPASGYTFSITFNLHILYKPISLIPTVENNTPYDLTFNGQLIKAGTPSVILPTVNDILYDVNSTLTYDYSFNWADTTTAILTGGIFNFNASPPAATSSISITTGSQISYLNYTDLALTSTFTDSVTNKPINPTTAVSMPIQPVMSNQILNTFAVCNLSDIQNYINSKQSTQPTINANFTFSAPQTQAPLITNFVFTNNTQQTLLITPGDSSSTDTNPIAIAGTGTWVETIPANYPPTPPHIISWKPTVGTYTGSCTTVLNQTNTGTGISCTLNDLNTGITTKLLFNGTEIMPDKYGDLAVSQAQIPLPPTSTPNTYEIILTQGTLINCVYNLKISNNTKYTITYNTTEINDTQTETIPITVTNGQTSTINLVWSGFPPDPPGPYFGGGPSVVSVICNSNGTGQISGIDRGSFTNPAPAGDYVPTMIAIAGTNPTFTQVGAASGQYNFQDLLNATGSEISLTFNAP